MPDRILLAFMQVGSFWKDCSSSCLEVSLLELSLRMWEGGYTVAISTAGSSGVSSHGGIRKLQVQHSV